MPSTATLFCAAFGVLSTAVLLQMRDALISYLCRLKLVLLGAERCWILHKRLRMTHFVTGYVCSARSDIVAGDCMYVYGRNLTHCGCIRLSGHQELGPGKTFAKVFPKVAVRSRKAESRAKVAVCGGLRR